MYFWPSFRADSPAAAITAFSSMHLPLQAESSAAITAFRHRISLRWQGPSATTALFWVNSDFVGCRCPQPLANRLFINVTSSSCRQISAAM
ncbi:hypothetical protein AVEN_61355-1 [Araneus ventricosus]|uniref:Uncharacterized protein n=1 Tax=Araneus ventricosus TaxID=182803 RepID=A0A4Y2MX17_ARAVE|nr:hypothetical protein AVEN_61355-1 [Araneus ventricosus]